MAKWLEKEVVSSIDGIPPIEEWQSARCSACGKYHTTPYMYYFDEYKFCPNCGQAMDGKDEPQNHSGEATEMVEVEPQINCKTCRHNKSGWYEKGSLSCEKCCGDNFEFYEPKDEPHRLSNMEWKEFLSQQFDISKTSAKEMLHGMMRWKKEDNFKRTFNPRNTESQERSK